MNTFNLQNIIDKFNLDEDSLAKQLFPSNKFPKLALSRVLTGKSYLDTSQISRINELLGTTVSDLFNDTAWNKVITGNVIKFHRNNHRVELNLDTHVSEIFLSDKLIAIETLISDKNIKLSEYLKLVDETIINLI